MRAIRAAHLLQQRPVLHEHVLLLHVVLRAQRLDLLLDAPLLWHMQYIAHQLHMRVAARGMLDAWYRFDSMPSAICVSSVPPNLTASIMQYGMCHAGHTCLQGCRAGNYRQRTRLCCSLSCASVASLAACTASFSFFCCSTCAAAASFRSLLCSLHRLPSVSGSAGKAAQLRTAWSAVGGGAGSQRKAGRQEGA